MSSRKLYIKMLIKGVLGLVLALVYSLMIFSAKYDCDIINFNDSYCFEGVIQTDMDTEIDFFGSVFLDGESKLADLSLCFGSVGDISSRSGSDMGDEPIISLEVHVSEDGIKFSTMDASLDSLLASYTGQIQESDIEGFISFLFKSNHQVDSEFMSYIRKAYIFEKMVKTPEGLGLVLKEKEDIQGLYDNLTFKDICLVNQVLRSFSLNYSNEKFDVYIKVKTS